MSAGGRPARSRLAALSVAATLVAAACSGGGDADTATDESTTTTTPGAEETTTTEAVAASTTTTEPVELTDSFRGVTEDAILVGYPTIDFDTLNSTFGLELTFASFAPAMEAIVEDLNARGGILGRRVDLLVRPYIPALAAAAESICVELTEDIGVFAVVGGFAGPGTSDVNECFSDLHQTIIVGGNPTPEQLDRAKAPWITNLMSQSRRARGLVDVLVANERLNELGRVAIIASTPADAPVMAAAREAFEDAGTSVGFDATVSTTGDEALTRAEIEIFVERGRTDDVDTFLFIGNDAFANEPLVLAGDEFNLLWLDSDAVTGWRTDPPPGIEDTRLILATGSGRSTRDDPDWGDCVRLTDEAYEVEIVPPHELELGDTNYWSAMVNACLAMRLFEQVAAAAGADLTNDSFAAAIDDFGAYTMPTSPFGSLGPGKYDGLDTLRLTTWDVTEGEWTPISDPFDHTP